MAYEPQGLAFFPGINQILDASYSNTIGTQAGVITISMVPQPGFIAEEGDFVLTFGSNQIVARSCKIDQSSIERNEAGEIWRVQLFDRRWKWQLFGAISGWYNQWRDDFSLRNGEAPTQVPLSADATKALEKGTLNTERTPRELATMCLESLGETNFDVSALPEEPRPTVNWEYEPPARALEELCESLGCMVCLQLDDTVRIVRVGEGAQLPNGGELVDSYSFDAPEMPDSIAIICGPTRFQVDFQLEAVGVDTGTTLGKKEEIIRRLDDLSYKPAAGWENIADVEYFTDIGTNDKDEDVTGCRALAQKSVFRYYRIFTPVKLPAYGKQPSRKRYKSKEEQQDDDDNNGQIKLLEQLLPIYPESIDLNVVSFQLEPGPAYVYGVWWDGLKGFENTLGKLTVMPDGPPQKVPGTLYRTPFYLRDFSIDPQRGLVIFGEAVYRNTDSAAEQDNGNPTTLKIGPARLVLRASCSVRNKKTGSFERYVRYRETGSEIKTGTRCISHDEITLAYRGTYAAGSYDLNYDQIENDGKTDSDARGFSKVTDNKEDVDKACDYYIDAALKQYQVDAAQQKVFPGLIPTNLDGAIMHVVYSVGPAGATTLVARNSEALDYTLSYKERRRIDYARAQQDAKKAEMKQRHLQARIALEQKTRHL